MKLKLGDRVRVKEGVRGASGYGTVGTPVDGEWVGRPDPGDGSWPVTLDGGRATRLFGHEVYVVREPGFVRDAS